MQRLVGLIRSSRFHAFLGLLLTLILIISLLPNEVLSQSTHFDLTLPSNWGSWFTSANATSGNITSENGTVAPPPILIPPVTVTENSTIATALPPELPPVVSSNSTVSANITPPVFPALGDIKSHTVSANVSPDKDHEVVSTSKKIHLKIPRGAVSSKTAIDLIEQPPTGPLGMVKLFELKAHDLATSTNITHFNKNLELTIQNEDSDLAGLDQDSLRLYYLSETTHQWVPLKDSKFDAEQKTIKATTDHFTYYGEIGNSLTSGPGRVMSADVDLHSGAATFSYPIELPTGPGGFKPKLELTYNSGSVDEMKNKQATASWVGMGWTLNLGRISWDSQKDVYYLELNGASYRLITTDGTHFHTNPEQYYKITSAGSNGKWEMWDQDGNYYRFGNNSDSQQHMPASSTVFRWDLDQIKDTNNNQANITYTQYFRTENNVTWLRSAYPSTLTYGCNNAFEVDFNSSFDILNDPMDGNLRQDNPKSYSDGEYVWNRAPKIMENKKLDSILIKANGNPVREYDFTYNKTNPTLSTDYGGIYYAGTFTLSTITQKGADGSSTLPAMSFTHQNNLPIYYYDSTQPGYSGNPGNPASISRSYLQTVNSGYGGAISFTYSQNPGDGTWDTWSREIVINKTIASGIGDVQSYSYNYLDTNNNPSKPQYLGNNWDALYRGFKQVKEKDNNNNNYSRHFYYAGGTEEAEKLAGKEYKTQWFSSSDTLLREVDNTWSAPVASGQQTEGKYVAQMTRPYSSNPVGITIGNDGYIYLASCAPYAIFKFDKAGNYVGQFVDANLNAPYGVAVDSSGCVYVASYNNNRILKFNPDGTLNNQFGFGYPNRPVALAVYNNIVYVVSDYSTGIFKFDATTGNSLGSIYSTLLFGGVALDSSGNIYAATGWYYGVIYKYNSNGNLLNTIYGGDGAYYKGITIAGDKIYTGYDDGIDKFTTSGQYLGRVYGGYSRNLTVDGIYIFATAPFLTSSYCVNILTRDTNWAVQLTQVDEITYNSGGGGGRTTRTKYAYDNNGNVITEYRYGEFQDANLDGVDDIPNDNSTVWRAYTNPNSTLNIVEKLARERVYSGIVTDDSGGANLKKETDYFYDGNNIAVNNPPNMSTTAPSIGNLTQQGQWTGASTWLDTYYTYDSYGNQLTVQDPNGNTATTTYDATYTYPATKTYPMGNMAESYTYDPGTNNLLTQTDVNGNTTSYYYDTFKRLIKVVKPGDSEASPSIRYDYNSWGTLYSQNIKTITKIDETHNLWQADYFDGLGRVIQTQAQGETNETIIAKTTTYNNRGLKEKEYVSQSIPFLLSAYYNTGIGSWKYTSYNYDGLGRVTTQNNADGTQVTTDYSTAWQNLFSSPGTTSGTSHWKRNYYNAFGKLIKVEELQDNQTLYATTNYTYDVLGNLTDVYDNNGNHTQMTYDWLSRKISMSDPDMGSWVYHYDETASTNGKGSLTSQVDAKGQTTYFNYDAMNRNISKTYSTGLTSVSYSYDSGTNGKGKRTGMTDASGSTVDTYDSRGRLLQETKTIDNVPYITSYTYDSADRLATITYPTNEVVTQTYNGRGLPDTLSGTSTGNIVNSTLYNYLGSLQQINLGNGTQTTYGYYGTGGANDTNTDTNGNFYSRLYGIKTVKNNYLTAYLTGWSNRVQITIDHTKIESSLTQFPVLVHLSAACGTNAADMSAIFNEVGINSKKIAVTEGDGVTQLYVEIEKWDLANKEALLWVSRPMWTISSTQDTILYLYYDNTHADNTGYVGLTNTSPAESVWDSNFKAVYHMNDSTTGATTYLLSNSGFENGTYNNLVTNGDFETWSSGPTQPPDGWSCTFPNGNTASRSTDAKVGTYAAQFTGGSIDSRLVRQLRTLTNGQTYTVGVWLKSVFGGTTMYVVLNDTNTSNLQTISTSWAYYTFTVTYTGTSGSNKYCDLGNTTASSTVLVDGFELVTNNPPTNWTFYQSGSGGLTSRTGYAPIHGGSSAVVLATGGTANLAQISQQYSGPVAGKTFTASAWVRATQAGAVSVILNDGATIFQSPYHTGDGTWQLLTVTGTAHSNATSVYETLRINSGYNMAALFDDANLTTSDGLLANNGFEYGTPPTGWSYGGTGGSFSRSSEHHGGAYSGQVTNTSGCYYQAYQYFGSSFTGKTATFGCWVKTTTTNNAWLRLGDDSRFIDSSYCPADGQWHYLQVQANIISTNPYAMMIAGNGNSPGNCYFDDTALYISDNAFSDNSSFENGTPPTGWSSTQNGAGTSFTRSSDRAKVGSYSGKLVNGGSQYEWIAHNSINFPIGTIVTMGAWLWASVPNFAYVQANDSGGAWSVAFHPGDSQWHWISTSISTLGTTFYGTPLATKPIAATAYVDDVTLFSHSPISVNDSTSNHNHGVKIGTYGPVQDNGLCGNAQSFDGVDDYIQIANSASLNPTSALTVESLAKIDALPTSDYPTLVVKDGLISARIDNQAEGNKCSFFVYAGNNWEPRASSNAVFTPNTYYNVAGTWDGASVKEYVDGVLNVSNAHSGTANPSSNSLYLGGLANSYCFNGSMDEVRLSSVARSSAWIKATNYTERDNLLSFGASQFGGWKNKVEITIDHTKIESDLTQFPVLVHLSASSGTNAADTSAVFNEVGNNSKKIAVTDANGVQLYVEIEKWDFANKEALLWISRPGWTISSTQDTILYLYYDNSRADNTAYVGVTNSTPAESVWDSNFKAVYHMSDRSTEVSLVNPGFEEGDPPTGWSAWQAVISSDASHVHSGRYSIKVVSNASPWGVAYQDPDPALVGKSVTFGTWIWCDTPNTAWLSIWGTGSVAHPGDSQWHFISYTAVMGSTSRVHLVVNNPGNAYFDDAILINVNPDYINDSTNNHNHGTKKGANEPTQSTGLAGQAQQFDGADDYARIATNASISPTAGGLTIETDLNLTEKTRDLQTLGMKWEGYNFCYGWDGSRPYLWEEIRTSVPDTRYLLGSDIVGSWDIQNNTWYHAVMVSDFNYIKAYVDGQLYQSKTWGAFTPGYTNADLVLGQATWLNDRKLAGKEDEFRISNIARSAAWIKATNYTERDNLLSFSTPTSEASEALQDIQYTWDPAGNLKTRQDVLAGEIENFTYDHLDRLKTASSTGGANNYNENYSYNQLGNFISKTDSIGTNYYAYKTGLSGPHAVAGLSQQKLIGAEVNDNIDAISEGNYFVLSEFTASQSGTINELMVKCSGTGHVKLAIYSDNNGQPGTLLNAVNDSTPVSAGLNTFIFPTTAINANTAYWLAFCSDNNIMGAKSTTGYRRFRYELYSNFSFPSSAGTGFTIDTANVDIISGWVGLAEFIYDANGNMTSRAGQAITWDAENRVTSIGNISYVYDGDGNRVKKIDNGVTTVYVNKYCEITSGNVTSNYYLGDRLIAVKKDTNLSFIYQDHLGSTSMTADTSGTITSTSKQMPYGAARLTSGALPTDKLFTGQRRDISTAGSELYYYNARYYDPNIGRFISADSIVPNPGNPQSLNRYSYCLNNPLKYIDPSGHDEFPWYLFYCPMPKNYDSYLDYYHRGGDCSYSTWNSGQEWVRGFVDTFKAQINGSVSRITTPTTLGDFHAQREAEYYMFTHPGDTIESIWDDYASKAGSSYGRGEISAEILPFLIFRGEGAVGENFLKQFGGVSQKYFMTSAGARFVDQFADQVAMESKVGRTSLTQFVRSQIQKDQALLVNGQAKRVEWHFFKSPVTGQGGPTGPLRTALTNAGITIIEH